MGYTAVRPHELKVPDVISIGRALPGGFGYDYCRASKSQLLATLALRDDREAVNEAARNIGYRVEWDSIDRSTYLVADNDRKAAAAAAKRADESSESPTPESPVTPEPEPTKETDPVIESVQPDTTSDVAKAIQDLIRATTTPAQSIDADAVRAIVAETLEATPARVEVSTLVLRENVTIGHVDGYKHPMFDKVARLANAGLNVMLKGPAGCGKTHLSEQVAQGLGKTYTTVSCSEGTSESVYEGLLLPTGENGRFEYVETPFPLAYRSDNSLILLDEFDSASPNTSLLLNAALANGYMSIAKRAAIPNGSCRIEQGKGSHIIANCNTFGTGADAVYSGRNQLDASTLDRFFVVEMTYDQTLERGMANSALRAGIEDALAILSEIHDIRRKADAAKLRVVVSTRMIQKAYRARSAGSGWPEVKSDLLASWSTSAKAAVGLH